MRLYGLIGYPLTHSYSMSIFNFRFIEEDIDARYELFPISKAEEIKEIILSNPDLSGLNITIPYKSSILPFLDHIDPLALKIGAVNTIVIDKHRGKVKLSGFNTDIIGFEKSLLKFIPGNEFDAIILGSGGASLAVQFVLSKYKIDFTVVSRKSFSKNTIPFSELDSRIFNTHHLIINATPLGMSPKTNDFPPIPYEFIGPSHYMFDLIYNPEETAFLRKGKELGAKTENGLSMLHSQAEASWEIWNK